jgi:hypothetical protein
MGCPHPMLSGMCGEILPDGGIPDGHTELERTLTCHVNTRLIACAGLKRSRVLCSGPEGAGSGEAHRFWCVQSLWLPQLNPCRRLLPHNTR